MKNTNNIPEKASLTGTVEKTLCSTCSEEYLFHLKDSQHHFSIGLKTILACVEFAEQEGALPKLPAEWWFDVKSRFDI